MLPENYFQVDTRNKKHPNEGVQKFKKVPTNLARLYMFNANVVLREIKFISGNESFSKNSAQDSWSSRQSIASDLTTHMIGSCAFLTVLSLTTGINTPFVRSFVTHLRLRYRHSDSIFVTKTFSLLLICLSLHLTDYIRNQTSAKIILFLIKNICLWSLVSKWC